VLVVMDNLAGHQTPEFVLWLFTHGIMPLYTPLSICATINYRIEADFRGWIS
jgi:hypothetical protein